MTLEEKRKKKKAFLPSFLQYLPQGMCIIAQKEVWKSWRITSVSFSFQLASVYTQTDSFIWRTYPELENYLVLIQFFWILWNYWLVNSCHLKISSGVLLTRTKVRSFLAKLNLSHLWANILVQIGYTGMWYECKCSLTDGLKYREVVNCKDENKVLLKQK